MLALNVASSDSSGSVLGVNGYYDTTEDAFGSTDHPASSTVYTINHVINSADIALLSGSATSSILEIFSGYNSATSGTIQVLSATCNAAAAATTTSLSTGTNPAIAGASVTLTATVTSSSTVNVGSVTFTDTTTSTTLCSNVAVNTSGVATCSTSFALARVHGLSASYSGASGFATSSGTTTQTVTPSVTALSPTSGSSSGGTSVTITGTGFDTTTANNSVSFGGTAASSFTVNSATQITATSPAGTGTVNVRVTTNSQTSATGSGNQFTFSGPVLGVVVSHTGNFTQGQNGALSIVASATVAATSGTVTVDLPLPTGATLQQVASGNEWNCTSSTTTRVLCTSSTSIAAGASASTITATVAIASNAATSLSFTGTFSGGGASSSATSTDTVTVNQTASTITKTAGDNQSAVTNAAFGTALQVTVKDGASVAISGASVTFTAPVSGASGTFASTGTRTETVTTNGSGIATSSTFTANGTAGSYSVTAASGSANASFSLTNTAAPAVSTSPSNQSVDAGTTATFFAAATGSPTPTVQWQQSTNGGATFSNIAGATSTALSFTASYSQNGNQYRAVFSNSAGSATTPAATLTVHPVADLVITNTDGVTSVTSGGTTTYTITASNAGPSDASGATVTDNLPAAISSATWTCVGAGGGTCTASGSGSISDTVNLPSGGSVTYTLVAQISSSASGTLDTTASISAPTGVADNSLSNNSAFDSDSIVLATTTTINPQRNPTKISTSVDLTASIVSSSFVTDGTVSFTDNGSPISGCSGIAVTNGGANAAATCTTSFATVGSHAIQATYSGSATFGGSSGSLTEYAVSAATVSAAFGTSSINTTGSTTLTVTLTNPNTVALSGVTLRGVSASPAFTGVSLDAGSTCSGATVSNNAPAATSFTLTANSSCTIVVTVPSGQSAGSHSYTPPAPQSSGANGQSLSQTGSAGTPVSLTVNAAPSVTTNPSDQSVNSGNTASFTAAASGNPAPTVQWQQSTNGGATFSNIAGATSTTLSFTTASGQDGNQYRAVFTNSVGSATTTAATLTVSQAPTVTSISPTTGPASGGTIVTITGTSFTGASAVSFGAHPAASFTVNSATSITARAPTGTGTVDVMVATTVGTSATSGSDQFTYVGAPTTTQAIASVTGVAGTALSVTPVTSSGGYGTVSYALSGGTLPSGLSFSTSNGVLSGTPTATFATTTFTVTATDSASQSSSQTFSLTVSAPTIAISPGSIPNATVGVAYSQTFTASGGNGSYSYSITAGALPAGMSLSSSGVLSGTPTAGGSFGFTITATDGNNFAGVLAHTLNVNGPTITVSPATISGLQVGLALSQTLTPNGGTAPYSVAVTGGSLPTGLTLSSAGVLSGTPTVQGSFNFTVTATDSSTGTAAPYSGAQAYSVTVTTGSQTISFTSTAPTGAAVGGTSYSVSATASSGLTVSFSLDASSTGCSISGTTISFNATGTCRINANQAGDGNWNAAPQVQQIFSVGAAQAIGASLSFSPSPLNAGATGTVTITFTNANAANSPTFTTTLTSPSNLTRVIGPLGGDCTVGTASVPTTTSVRFSATFVPAGGCTITLNYTGTAAGDVPGFTLSGFTPSGYPATSGVTGSNVVVLPTVTAINPSSGRVNQSVTLTGTGFDTTPANNTVTFGGTQAVVTAATATSLTVTVPSTGSGTVSVTVTVNGQTTPTGVNWTFINTPIVADKTGVAVPYNSSGTAIDLSASITGGPHSSIAIGTAPQHGTTSITGDVVTYTPANGYYGADSFTYTASGTGGLSGTATVSLTVATPPAPTTQPGSTSLASSTSVQGGGSVDVDLSSLITGVYGTVQISTPPAHGTVTLNLPAAAAPGTQVSQAAPRFSATYRANAGYYGSDSFQFVAVGPGGPSAPATVTITVTGRPPVVLAKTAATIDNQAVDIDLTAGATEGPFTSAAIVNAPPTSQATVQLIESGPVGNRLYHVAITPAARYSGTLVLTYTISNQFGASPPQTVTVTVTARPDPTLDPTVQAISDAEAEATRDLARVQISNFTRRTEALHHGDGASGSPLGIQLVSRNPSTYPGGRFASPGNDPRTLVGLPDNGYSTGDPSTAIRRLAATGSMFGTGGGFGMARDPSSQDEAQRSPAQKADRYSAANSDAGDGTRHTGSIAIWSGGAVEIGTRDRETGRDKITISSAGLSAGADVKLSDNAIVGIGGGYGAEVNKIGGTGGSEVQSDSAVVAAYGSVRPFGATFIDAVIGYGSLGYTSQRAVAINNSVARGQRSGTMWFGSVSAGIDRLEGAFQWSAYGRLEWLDARLGTYSETGAGIYNLRFLDRSLTSISSVLGGKLGFVQKFDVVTVLPRLRVEWRHEFQNASQQLLDYADISNPAYYALDAIGYRRDQIDLGVGSKFVFGRGWGLDLEMDFTAAEKQRRGTLRAGITKKF